MSIVLKIPSLLLANVIGFFAAGICFNVGQLGGLISSEPLTELDPNAYITNIMVIWAVCAAFSVAYFFFKEKIGYIFLLAPAFIPYLYGFSALFLKFPL